MNKKNFIIGSSVSIMGVLLLVFGVILLKKDNNVASEEDLVRKYLTSSNEVLVYEEKYLSEFIGIKNGKLIEDKIDTSTLGTKEVEFTYKNKKGHIKKGTFPVTIVDKTKPLIWLNETYTYQKGSNMNLEEAILCGDNYDRNPVCRIEGEYNLNEIGEYPLTYKAIDNSGNETIQNFTLKVIEKPKTQGTITKVSLEEIKKNYLNENQVLGIDVSKWQGKIDFNRVKENDIEFVMIRMGTQKGPKEDSILDSYFKENIENAKKAGLKVGVYYYSYASSKEEAKKQAEWVIKKISKYQLDLPVVFDWECYSFFNSFQISFHDLNEIADTFLSTIEKNGYTGMLYGSKNYLESIWETGKYKTWLAHYTTKTTYQQEYLMWQFTNKGEIPGIEGAVDVDLMNIKEK